MVGMSNENLLMIWQVSKQFHEQDFPLLQVQEIMDGGAS